MIPKCENNWVDMACRLWTKLRFKVVVVVFKYFWFCFFPLKDLGLPHLLVRMLSRVRMVHRGALPLSQAEVSKSSAWHKLVTEK